MSGLKNGTFNSSDTDTLKKFMTELGSEIDSLSVSPPAGSNRLILYGGWNGDAPMWQIAVSAANSGQVHYYISQTEAGSGCCRSVKDRIIKHRKKHDRNYHIILYTYKKA